MKRIHLWLSKHQRYVWLEYSALALVILLPLLLPGYILTLDLVFTPHSVWPQEITNTYPLQIILWMLHLIIPGDVIEKMILFSILLLSGVGMHLLVKSLSVGKSLLPFWNIATYFAGIFYMINPFVYSRFMAGQWMVLLGYALLPFLVRSLFSFLKLPTWKNSGILGLWITLIIGVSLHHIGIVIVLFLSIVGAGLFRYWRDRTAFKRFSGGVAMVIGVVIIFSGYWLIPAISGCGTISKSVTSFNDGHFSAFATNSSGVLGAFGEVIRLQGFWVEARDLYVLPQSLVPLWGLVILLLWGLVVIGGFKAWRSHRFVILFGLICITSGVLLAGTPLIEQVSKILPYVDGYREPHKLVNLIVLGYALLGAFGVAYMQKWAKRRYGNGSLNLVGALCLCLPIIITPTMLWGFGGQLTPRQYPQEWNTLNKKLKADLPEGNRVLFLPWHQYATYSFSGGRIIANPAQKFFEVPVVISDEPEFQNISPTTPNDEKRRIAAALRQPDHLADVLKDLGVEYVILAKEQDSEKYDFLNHMTDFHSVNENDKLKLYKVEVKDE